ncbi:rRNA-processing protein Ebp2p [[Candida] anglica]|uniref:rRNA-processing protein Ebp2p n=1 Tax=[Candida] anglica TaxID=148631 RepID=A0ABP0EGW1_9ASCO
MAKGGLKTQLKIQKEADKGKKVEKKAEKKLEAVEKSKPVEKPVVTPGELKRMRKEKKEKDAYQSGVLSKKEQRQLKKAEAEAEAAAAAEEEAEQEDDEEESDVEDVEEELDLERLAASESESDINDEEDEDEDEEDEEDEEEDPEAGASESEAEDIPLSDVEIDSDADIVPHTKLTINNMAALKDSLARIELPWAKHSFQEHQSVVSADHTEASIKDIYDDTERELAFYKQGLDAVKQARSTLFKLKVPFSRPMDYFAEMVKSDEHMDKLKSKLLTEAANKKASEDAKKQRSLKKFGKQVQHATLQDRAKQKKESLEKIKSLRKRGNNEFSNDDDFQIALEEATREDRDGSSGHDNKRRKPNAKRMAKDSKYGSGGIKRGSRKNDAQSSMDVSGFSAKKMKGKTARPGKSKRSRRG